MGKPKTIDSFFKRKADVAEQSVSGKKSKASTSGNENQERTREIPVDNENQEQTHEIPQTMPNQVDSISNNLERDPAKRKQMWEYHVNEREQVRRAYLSLGPYQVKLNANEYENKGDAKHTRRFQYAWFKIYPNWLEYSTTTHSAYCFLCYLFNDHPSVSHGYDAFTVKGFDKWKKVNGKQCSFLKHVGTSQHRNALAYIENLLNQAAHIENFIEHQNVEQIRKNRLRLGATIDVVRWLTFQACALRGHDESSTSKNKGNFLELLELLASYNDELANVILGNAPYNSKYTSSAIQKECLNIIANKVRRHIRSEVGDSPYCIMVDESRDESKKEQMAIVLRFVDSKGLICERFLDLVHVSETTSQTLFSNIWAQLEHHQFDLSKIRGQGYDGASNMRGEWNGLHALFIKENPYAYYVHCFAHRLQLALVYAAREVIPVHQFFTNLLIVINAVCASSKRHDELQKEKRGQTARLVELGEIDTGTGLNQVGTISRPGDTRWGSHYYSICSLFEMFAVTRIVLQGLIMDKKNNFAQRGDADAANTILGSFEFVFILHVMKEVLGRTELLSQALQRKSQDILNAMELVASTNVSLNNLRNNGWDDFLEEVTFFCNFHVVEMPDMKASYCATRFRPRKTDNQVTFEHYYRVDVFTEILDTQIHELNSRFNEKSMELLSLSSSLCSKEINVEEICRLVEKYYPKDFTDHEKDQLKYELRLFNINKANNNILRGVSSLADLCRTLVETRKCETYSLLYRVVQLIMTLPVTTATTERAFSAMKIVKNRLRNKMSDEFLADSLVINIEREITESFDTSSIIEEFKNLKGRRAEL